MSERKKPGWWTIRKWKKRIARMGIDEMARLWRFAPGGHIVFRMDLPLYQQFETRFRSLGGWTPALSKKIGWTPPKEEKG